VAFLGLSRLCSTNRPEVGLSLTPDGFRLQPLFGYPKRCETVEDHGADLDFRDLSIEVTRGETLTEQSHTMHPLPGRVCVA
jgi:hypothetical protein